MPMATPFVQLGGLLLNEIELGTGNIGAKFESMLLPTNMRVQVTAICTTGPAPEFPMLPFNAVTTWLAGHVSICDVPLGIPALVCDSVVELITGARPLTPS